MKDVLVEFRGFSLRHGDLRLAFLLIILLELLSFFGWVFPSFGNIAMLALLAIAAVVTLVDLRAGVALTIAELAIGSHGYLLAYLHHGLAVSIRIGLFLVVTSIAFMRAVQQRQLRIWSSPFRWYFVTLLAAVIAAAVRGAMVGNGFANVFFDANAFLFFGMVVSLWQAIKTSDDVVYLARYAFIAVCASTAKVLLLTYMFSHALWWALPETYRWVRDTRIGELTQVTDTFFRVFFQSQIYAVMAIFIVLAFAIWRWKEQSWRATLGVLALLMASTLVSLSRSNWLGMVVAFATLPGLLYWARLPVKTWFVRAILAMSGATILALAIVAALILVPFPPNNGQFSAGLFGSRALTFDEEAGVGSRWALIGPLWTAIKATPFIGQGFGKEVTYKTQDPRLLAQNPTGEYTTFIFEWGYHDLWLKLGLIGLAAYIALIGIILYHALCYLRTSVLLWPKVLVLGMTLSFIALLVTHTTSPYLNHPLGISYLLVYALIVDLFDRREKRS